MFLKNLWYCAGWENALSMGKSALLTKKIAGEDLVLYRTDQGQIVALEDQCCHKQAPLSLGRKEGDSLRCMYHGWRYASDGKCIEIPGQTRIPQRACVRSYPVVVKNDWIWVWLGDPALADETLICDSVGPTTSGWETRSGYVEVNANYRLEIANLADLTHVAWTHMDTFGGTEAYSAARTDFELSETGAVSDMWLRGVPAPKFAQHLFPADALMDLHFDVTYTLPCNFNMHFCVHAAGSATSGPSDGDLLLDSFTSQAVTPRDEDWVDYYFAWGTREGSSPPGMVEMLLESVTEAFLEDKEMLEGQHARMSSKPDFKQVGYQHDAGANKLLWMLDTLLEQERKATAP